MTSWDYLGHLDIWTIRTYVYDVAYLFSRLELSGTIPADIKSVVLTEIFALRAMHPGPQPDCAGEL